MLNQRMIDNMQIGKFGVNHLSTLSHVVVAGREGRVECFKPRTQEQKPLSKNPEPEEQQIFGREEAPLLESSDDLDDTFSNQLCRSLDPVNIH